VKALTRNNNPDSKNMLEFEHQNINEPNESASTKPYDKSRQYSGATKSLLIISLSYAILSLPYLIAWFLYFIKVAFKHSSSNQNDMIRKNYLFAFLQISEIGFILNYSIHFYIYCAFDSIFLKHLFNNKNRTVIKRRK